ncbi:MAG: 16S rRNA (adenine(1518)-N(6)/adenine(1519)-N(6))-dimethyltransferase RsmA [Acidimicrobiia bacterium]
MPPVLTPMTVHALLAEHDIRPKKSLGQNFLVDPNTARRIVTLAELPTGGPVLEIGPGLGSLTLALVEHGHHVVAVELDARLARALGEVLTSAAAASHVRIEVADALSVEFTELLTEGRATGDNWSSVSNLPYNVAVPVVMRLLEEAPAIRRLLVMVQREVGERLAAVPGDALYGAVSVKAAYFADAKVVGVVPPTVFVPRPNVESVLVRMHRHASPPVSVPSPDELFTLVRAGFGQRRKMLRRSLQPLLGGRTLSVLADAGVEPTARAEELGLAEWAAVSRCVAAFE